MYLTEPARKFEIPYNFDLNLIKGLQILNLPFDFIQYIYVSPHPNDYLGVGRAGTDKIQQMTWEEYSFHINYIKKYFPNKLQLLLQKTSPEELISKETLLKYIDLGFTSFCCGSLEQAKMIKSIDSKFETIASITSHVDAKTIKENAPDYLKYFNYIVLDFHYNRNLQEIKELPPEMNYILLINSICNSKCKGTQHWFSEGKAFECPGLIVSKGFDNSCLIRPMDLKYFDPYIKIYKIQDRSWPTFEILHDIILYTTDFSYYPGIKYDEDIYEVLS